MNLFAGNLQLDFGDWGKAGRIAILLSPVTRSCDRSGYDLVVTIPFGFMSDGASVPWFLWWFLPPWGSRVTFAALLHDYLLDRLQGFIPGGAVPGAETRQKCDRHFLLACIDLKVSRWQAIPAWLGIRAHSAVLALRGANDEPIEGEVS